MKKGQTNFAYLTPSPYSQSPSPSLTSSLSLFSLCLSFSSPNVFSFPTQHVPFELKCNHIEPTFNHSNLSSASLCHTTLPFFSRKRSPKLSTSCGDLLLVNHHQVSTYPNLHKLLLSFFLFFFFFFFFFGCLFWLFLSMEHEFFLNAGMPTWHSLSSAMDIQGTDQSSDCLLNPSWETSADHGAHFDSALSSMVSSPAASNTNVPNDSFVIRELIGKLGNIGNSGEISPHSGPLLGNAAIAAAATSYNSANTSAYTTPLSSPPKLGVALIKHLVNESSPNSGKPMPLNSSVAEFSADPGFAERAARFSRFGSRSFNGRTTQFVPNNAEVPYKSNLLPRVASSPSLKAVGSQMGAQESNNSPELANSQEESTVSEQIPNGETGLKGTQDSNSRKRKAASKGKAKEPALSPFANATKVQTS